MAARFEIYQDKQGLYRFRLIAANSQLIATGQGYKSKKSCKKGIASIIKNAPVAGIVDTTL